MSDTGSRAVTGDAGTYVYAVARSAVECPDGVGSVRTVAGAGLVAYVSTVPLAEFGEEPLRRSLEDLDWLSVTARAHHRVVETVAAATPTAPVRLVTVYADDQQVRDLLERRRDDFLDVLSHVTGRREWGVKVYAGHSSEPSATARGGGDARKPEGGDAHKPGNGDARKPGTAYLERRRAGLRGREQVRRQLLARADHMHAALSALSVASCRHRAQDPHLSGRTEMMVLNGAYLVDEGRDEEFAAAAGGLGGDGVEVRLTGPWAPYSFTVMEAR
ncbi:gas vesicle synthesis GvpLF [Nonomuraea phyllanthi]|uniref:Gas vesicle synthesis GvpLF n=1 Tax=Nonomuraea phyllanthi TaxID=2219224 RepID=A0A5C4WX09_9ACTN|nr:gas vesicle synthesis GvpLF [Nonomuraea phyllanthi]